MGAATGVHRVRVRQMRERERALTAIVFERTHELELAKGAAEAANRRRASSWPT